MFNRNLLNSPYEDECYEKLVESYKQWHGNNNFLAEISNEFEESTFLSSLKKFKAYINYASHPYKCTRTQLIINSYYVGYSEEFKQLNATINELLNITEFSYYCSQAIECLGTFINDLQLYIKEHPLQVGLVLFLGFATIAAFLQKLSPSETTKTAHDFFRDISTIPKTCQPKVNGKNQGKICKIENTKYYMKNVNIRSKELFNNPLVGIHHKKILNNIPIITPDFYFFRDLTTNTDYLASEEVKNLQLAELLFQPYLENLLLQNNNLAKLAIANTFIGDLKLDNYGFIGNDLVIIDLDMRLNILQLGHSSDERSWEYLKNGVSRLTSDRLMLQLPPLAKHDVEYMKDVYFKMHQLPAPEVFFAFDMDSKTYKKLISHYIRICNDFLKNEPTLRTSKLNNIKNRYYANTFFHSRALEIIADEKKHLQRPGM